MSCTRRCHRIQGRESSLSVVVWPQIRLRAPRTWLTTGHDFTRPTFNGESSQVLFQILLLQARSSLTSIMHFKPQHACYFCLTPTCHLCLIQLQSRKCQTQSCCSRQASRSQSRGRLADETHVGGLFSSSSSSVTLARRTVVLTCIGSSWLELDGCGGIAMCSRIIARWCCCCFCSISLVRKCPHNRSSTLTHGLENPLARCATICRALLGSDRFRPTPLEAKLAQTSPRPV